LSPSSGTFSLELSNFGAARWPPYLPWVASWIYTCIVDVTQAYTSGLVMDTFVFVAPCGFDRQHLWVLLS